jgi:predicted permease
MRRRKHILDDLDQDIREHIERETQDNIDRGMSPGEARYAALRKFGNVTRVKEETREVWSTVWLEHLAQDIRFGLRTLRKSPSFTIVAILTLALGIGANTAIFSVVNAVLLRPLPYKNAARIVWAAERFPFNQDSAVVLSPDFLVWKDGNDVFEKIGAFGGSSGANLTGAAEAERVSVTNVTTDLFELLGIQPLIGRTFLPDEAKEVRSHVALLNEVLWRNRFGADSHIVGKTINLDGTAYTVVGVMPGGIRYPRADVWSPLALDSETFSAHSPRWMMLTVIGLLKPGVTLDQAKANLQVLTKRMDQLYPPEAARFRANAHADVVPLHDVLVRDVRSLLFILLGAVGLVLLIACANVANLLLSRAAARSREIAVRATLGAGRWRLVQQMLTESLLLAASGALFGLVAGFWGTQLLKQLIPSDLPSSVTVEWRTLAFVAALAILSVMLFGLVPALIASISNVNESLKDGPLVKRHRASRLRSFLVLAEISLSLVLLVGAGLLVRSFLRLTEVPLGFEPSHLVLATVQRPLTLGYDSPQHAVFFREALDRINALPGVQSADMTRQYPLGELNNAAIQLRLADGTLYRPGTPILLDTISPGYFRTMGIPLLKGRFFDDHDSADAQRVAILSESLARGAFKEHDPLGQRFSIGPNAPESTVVGVVADTRNSTLDQNPLPEIFAPYLQQPSFVMSFVVRSKADPHGLAGDVRQALLTVDKDQPLSELQTMDDLLASSVAPRRFQVLLVGLFAVLALALAAVGIYGLIAYSVGQRTHEIGIRMALGAQRLNVMKLVLGEGTLLALGGVALGIAGALWLTRFLGSFLFEVKPTDPITFACVAILLTVVALAASYIPARRAMRVDPMVALRYE